jgi:hypothetical protein
VNASTRVDDFPGFLPGLRKLSTLVSILALGACTGALIEPSGKADGPNPGAGGSSSSQPNTWKPVEPCAPVAMTRVQRLSDRHLANALRDLLNLENAPEIRTSSSALEQFLPNKPALVTGAVAAKLRTVVEELATEATLPGKPSIECTGDSTACATGFIDRFASRAFRRPISDVERADLLRVHASGVENHGGYAGGVRLVVEAVLQSPSFLYQTEFGATAGTNTLTAYELASKLSFFLLDSIPDDELWRATVDGKLETDQQIAAQVDRLLQRADVKANLTRIFSRLFDLDRIFRTTKAAHITEFTPALVASMHQETTQFIDATLWRRSGTLSDLFTSRETFADASIARIYGLPAPGASGFMPVTAPPERAGILTHPSLMTMEALPDESSVVHRGVFIVRELLCLHPPPPDPSFLQMGEQFKTLEPTERGRARLRAENEVCRGCHGTFDPFGIAFEHYDTLGRYRSTLKTPDGDVPVDASSDFKVFDIEARVENGVDLSRLMAESRAVRECLTRQVASYALGQRLTNAQACTIGDLARRFDEGGGNLVDLIRLVAGWPGLRNRQETP